MSAGGINTPEVLNELETHLREDVEQQMASGLTAQLAFEAAVRHIGRAGLLRSEFAGAEDGTQRERKIAGLLMALAAMPYFLFATVGLFKIEMNTSERLVGIAAVAVSVLFGCSGAFAHHFLPVLPDHRARTTVQIFCALPAVIWLLGFLYLVLPHCDFTLGQLLVAILWAMVPLAIAWGVTNGMDKAAHARLVTADA